MPTRKYSAAITIMHRLVLTAIVSPLLKHYQVGLAIVLYQNKFGIYLESN
ncbi:MAG UNVERIFIED_CONTAM: hypothetical protein LVQ98_03605 [Rickettsiaceae bacterium]